jgi:hypothetical protein
VWFADMNWTWFARSAGLTGSSASSYSMVSVFKKAVEVKGYLINASASSPTTIYRPQDYTFVTPPSGFASGMQESNGFDVYTGTISFKSSVPGATRYRGCVVNVSGHRSEYASMLAMVRGERLDLDSGTTTLTLGAPPRFSYRSFMDRIRSRASDNVIYL